MSLNAAPTLHDLVPLPYHDAVVGFLKEFEPELWQWTASADAEREYLESMRTGLLKECYRLDADGHPELVQQCAAVARRLDIGATITLYQSSGNGSMNAALYYAPGEAHVVFTGPVLATLSAQELEAVLAHELAHYRLWEQRNKECLIADRLMSAAANDARATASHIHTARRLRLYTEIYADRGAFVGCQNLEPAVAALVKMSTGLAQVSAASYLRQADELFSKGERGGRGIDHPETFIRARALRLWIAGDATLDEWLASEIEGASSLDELDILGQQRLTNLTRRFVCDLLAPTWMQSAAVLAHARAFFPDIVPQAQSVLHADAAFASQDAATQDYWCYLLLDFARIDRELEDLPLAHAWAVSAKLGLAERFEKLVTKELHLNKRQLAKLKKEAPELLAKATK
jgi:hypothetical protein